MSGLVDSHAHLDMDAFDRDREEVVARAFRSGIRAILCPADTTEDKSVSTIQDLTRKNPNIIAAVGVHPHQAKAYSDRAETEIRRLAENKAIYAVGEIGLDFHYDFSPADVQIDVFRRQLQLAEELTLPVIIHSRLAERDILQALDGVSYSQGGVLHCFTESGPFARSMLDRGFFISFSGIVTFRNAHRLQDVARDIPLDRLMIETDSPYLTPEPHRGRVKRNEPMYLNETAHFLADLAKIPYPDLAAATARNFESCFRFEIMVL